MTLGIYSYLTAAAAYGVFTLLMLLSLSKSTQGRLLVAVALGSVVWAVMASYVSAQKNDFTQYYQVSEVFRYILWYVFLLKLFDTPATAGSSYQAFVQKALPLTVTLAAVLLCGELFFASFPLSYEITGHLLLALIGLAIIEQLLRNTSAQHRWAIKYLFIGAGGMFAFDFYMYADALLFRGIDENIWDARGVIHVFAVPLIAVSAARNKKWSLNIFVSREIVLNTTALLGGGLYLILMAAAGYYLKEFGGSWGRIGQITFFSLAVLLLAAILASSQLRAKVKVFLAKHFYKNKYDYRVEWLRLTGELGDSAAGEARFRAVIEALAHIVEARAGMLWLRNNQQKFSNVVAWNCARLDAELQSDASLIRFLRTKGYIINVPELRLKPEEYEALDLPTWMPMVAQPWLVLPLYGIDGLMGFVLLSNPLVTRAINWEDRDLLNTAAKQIANHLTVLMTSDALAEARQFEVFTRLSAYMVHDLKNIAAELELVARNAKKHITNPDFVADAFETVANAALDIRRLLDQLRNRRAESEKKVILDVCALLRDVTESKQASLPQPQLSLGVQSCHLLAEKGRLKNVMAHLIENAQQATAEDGMVSIRLQIDAKDCLIEINDSGHGMDEAFIRERLFKPFDTTKGNAGMGIGMYESREVIRQLGGDIRVSSVVGQGSSIIIVLPTCETAPEASDSV